MAETNPIVAQHNSPEKVALDLLTMISLIEKRSLHAGPPQGWQSADRKWLLDTFAECMSTVRQPEKRDVG